MNRICIDGIEYHAREVYNDMDIPTDQLELIVDENGNPIPASECICAAWEPNECCCGAWDDVDLDSWYREY